MTMTAPHQATSTLGSNLVAMVTPMDPDGAVSTDGVHALVDHLVATGCDGLVVGGTTGESPTLTESESKELVAMVVARAKGGARVVAGVGTYDTTASIRRARAAEAAGADALLVVTPYYSRPSQDGLVAHCTAVADATALPVMLYDVPHRTGTSLELDALYRLADHPQIVAIKDAKGDLFEAMTMMATTSLAYYCGIDELNLPYLACGASGIVSVTGHVAADRNAALMSAVRDGCLDDAVRINRELLVLAAAMLQPGPGAVTAKAALAESNVIPHATVRLPLIEAPARVGASA